VPQVVLALNDAPLPPSALVEFHAVPILHPNQPVIPTDTSFHAQGDVSGFSNSLYVAVVFGSV
jgi:hypothetical protein